MIELKLKTEAVELILAALGKQPFEIVAPLIAEIRQQAVPQVTKDEAPAE
jgi:hypothetical protein